MEHAMSDSTALAQVRLQRDDTYVPLPVLTREVQRKVARAVGGPVIHDDELARPLPVLGLG